MTKKIKHILIFLLLLIPYNSFAKGECKIANGPDIELLNYIANIKKIVSNTTNEIVKNQQSLQITKDYNKINSLLYNKTSRLIIGLYNNNGSIESYWMTWRYYVLNIKEIPYEIKRDNDLIEKENKGLSKFLEKIISMQASDSIIKNACKGVKMNNCYLDNKSAKFIVGELLRDTETLSYTYKQKILGDNTNGDIRFGGPKFNEIWNSYNPKMVSICSKENGMLKTVNQAIQSFSNTTNKGTNGIQIWQDSIDLMLGRSKNYEETEKNLLKKELSRQGINSSNADIIIGNLEKYNRKNGDGGFSEKNNLITNSYDTINNNLGEQYNNFKKDIFSPLKEKDANLNKKEISENIKKIIDLGQKNDITINIALRVSEVYQNEALFSRIEDTNTQKLQGKLFSMHSNIISAIKKLNQIIPISEKVCNSQDNGNGICTTK